LVPQWEKWEPGTVLRGVFYMLDPRSWRREKNRGPVGQNKPTNKIMRWGHDSGNRKGKERRSKWGNDRLRTEETICWFGLKKVVPDTMSVPMMNPG